MRLCKWCGLKKPLEAFPKDSRSREGRATKCKSCTYAQTAASKAAWAAANPEKVKEYKKADYRRNKPKRRAKQEEWKEANPVRVKETKAEWGTANPDNLRQSGYRRRARKAAAPSEPYARAEIFERDNWMCKLCHTPVDRELSYPDPGFATIDHRIPLARGGDDTSANVQLAHLRCNLSKKDRLEDEWGGTRT